MLTANNNDRKAATAALQKSGKAVTDEAIEQQMYDTFYDRAFAASDFGTGGNVQRAITAATTVVQGLAGGDIAAAIAGGAAPYIANEIGKQIPEENMVGRVLAHAAVNAALAAVQGRDMGVAAAGAATGELAGKIAKDAYNKDISELSETDKQTISALATLASALAGGLIGDSGSTTIAAAQAGKTTVENNLLGCSGSSDPLCVGKKDLLTTGGGGLGPVAGGIGAAGVLTTGGDKEGEDQPNVGKDLTDAEKAELGGAGSGTGTQPPPENDPKQQSDEKPSNIKVADDKFLKKNGIDAHELKKDFLGKKLK